MTPWSLRRHAAALAGYSAAAIGLSWPLPLHLGTHLTGSPAGDTGVYIWNQWVFRHELLVNRSLPYFTDSIFAFTGRANLSLHNYTTFQNLLALPLMPRLGVVATFNVVYLLMTVLTAYATFLLARHITGRDAESWLAGLLFAWSPILVTRGTAHFSMVAAAPLAVFILLLLRAVTRERPRDALALGATMWWAASTDVYFAVYCLIIAATFLLARVIRLERRSAAASRRVVPWTLDVLLLCVGGLMLAMLISGGWQFRVLGRLTRMQTLYTPMLLFTALCVARALWYYRAAFAGVSRDDVWRLVRATSVAGVVATFMLSPVLYAIGVRIADGQWDSSQVFWRSSPAGVDALAFILPNPNHPFAPEALRAWLTPRPDAYAENVASLTLMGLAVIAGAWRAGWRIPRMWAALGVTFGTLALGPFVHVAGINTFMPGPWAFLRYVPIVGLARTPARFSIVVMLIVAVLFAAALAWLGQRWPRRRTLVLSAVAGLLVFELLPVPRVLYSAEVPAVYRRVAAAPGNARVLDLPFGLRDGTSSYGDFSARSQYFQTMHQKPLAGGYLSRIASRRVAAARRDPMVAALITLSEGHPLDPRLEGALVEQGPSFASRARVGFVVIDRTRASAALRTFAVRALRLELLERDGAFELYRPVPTRVEGPFTTSQ
jgi:hypothetical protein